MSVSCGCSLAALQRRHRSVRCRSAVRVAMVRNGLCPPTLALNRFPGAMRLRLPATIECLPKIADSFDAMCTRRAATCIQAACHPGVANRAANRAGFVDRKGVPVSRYREYGDRGISFHSRAGYCSLIRTTLCTFPVVLQQRAGLVADG